ICLCVEWLMPVQSGEITNILLLLQGQHQCVLVALAKTVSQFTHNCTHIHPALAHRVRYLHSLVRPCEAGTNFTHTTHHTHYTHTHTHTTHTHNTNTHTHYTHNTNTHTTHYTHYTHSLHTHTHYTHSLHTHTTHTHYTHTLTTQTHILQPHSVSVFSMHPLPIKSSIHPATVSECTRLRLLSVLKIAPAL